MGSRLLPSLSKAWNGARYSSTGHASEMIGQHCFFCERLDSFRVQVSTDDLTLASLPNTLLSRPEAMTVWRATTRCTLEASTLVNRPPLLYCFLRRPHTFQLALPAEAAG